MTPSQHPAARAWELLNAGDEPQAVKLLTTFLARKPTDPLANKIIAMVHGAHDRFDQAAFHLRRAVAAAPNDFHIQYMLGNVLFSQQKFAEAAAAYRTSVRLSPTYTEARDGLARCQISLNKFADALTTYREGIAAVPDNPRPISTMIGVMLHIGRSKEAMDATLEGLARFPYDEDLLKYAAFTANLVEGVPPREHRRYHERLGAVYASRTTRPAPVFANSKDPRRPLRVGFLSGDFGMHVCAAFMKPLLLNFDPSAVIPYCYSTKPDDGGEAPFKERCQWRDVVRSNDDELAAMVMNDGIDILVECSGVTPGARFQALVPRIAPIQCTFLGYPNTTGLPTMDYRIVDAWTDPPGSESHCTEKLARLDRCFLCYTPSPWAPEPTPSAAADPAHPVTFGSFNRITKISGGTLDAWCDTLRRVPNSKMLIKLRTMSEELRKDAFAGFISRGLSEDRIVIAHWTADASEHSQMYCQMDIALDSFPYNGTTTTCEALWMGVPVIALAGDTHRARVGVSLLHAVGLQELVAKDADDYARIASELANDRPRLMAMKAGLRARMAASPLRDEQGYARSFEKLLRDMWREWCGGVA
ncbi:MAG: tetratricopeptide repeat protein [Planctomycetes bacterium]|nr:tetratricopeptide repeat protein [Planctomycetota bacterium]